MAQKPSEIEKQLKEAVKDPVFMEDGRKTMEEDFRYVDSESAGRIDKLELLRFAEGLREKARSVVEEEPDLGRQYADGFKAGRAEGLRQAADMLEEFLEEPEG